MKALSFLILISVFTLSSFAADAITGGGPVNSPLINPHVVALWDSVRTMLCTGTVVAQNMVLTAGHCIAQSEVSNLHIVTSTDLTQSTITMQPVQKFYVANQYDPNYITEPKFPIIQPQPGPGVYDFALVIAETPLPSQFQPVSLVPANATFSEGEQGYIVGYSSKIMEIASVHLSQLNTAWPELLSLTSHDNAGTSPGDSGGPVFVDWNNTLYLAGVIDGNVSYPSGPSFDYYANLLYYGNTVRGWMASE